MEKQENQQDDTMDKKVECKNYSLGLVYALMCTGGCYFASTKTKVGQILNKLLWAYQVVLLLYLISSIVRTVAVYTDRDNEILIYIITMTYLIQGITNSMISWKAFSDSYGHQRKTLAFLNETIKPLMESADIKLDRRSFQRKQILVVIIASALYLIMSMCQISLYCIFYSTPDVMHSLNMSTLMTYPFTDSYPTRMLVLLPTVLVGMNIVSVTFYLVTVSILMTSIFRSYNMFVRQQITENRTSFISSLEILRNIHTKLCTAIEDFDGDVGYYYGNSYLWTILSSIGTLYMIIKIDMDILTLSVMCFYLFMWLGLLFMMSIFAASVHEEAHKPLSFLYNINLDDMDTTKLAQLNVFLSKLTGTQIGFTICGLLIITKELILSIVGVFVTYFAVLYTL